MNNIDYLKHWIWKLEMECEYNNRIVLKTLTNALAKLYREQAYV